MPSTDGAPLRRSEPNEPDQQFSKRARNADTRSRTEFGESPIRYLEQPTDSEWPLIKARIDGIGDYWRPKTEQLTQVALWLQVESGRPGGARSRVMDALNERREELSDFSEEPQTDTSDTKASDATAGDEDSLTQGELEAPEQSDLVGAPDPEPEPELEEPVFEAPSETSPVPAAGPDRSISADDGLALLATTDGGEPDPETDDESNENDDETEPDNDADEPQLAAFM